MNLLQLLLKLFYFLILKPYILDYITTNKLRALRSELDVKDELLAKDGDGALSFIYPKYQSGFPEIILLPDRDTREKYKIIDVMFLPLFAIKDSDYKKPDIEYYTILTIILLYIAFTPPFAKDDLFRHLKTWDGERFKDYREIYIMKWSFGFPIYPVWDVLYGISYKIFHTWSLKFWELLSMLIFLAVYTIVTSHLPQHIRLLLLIFIIDFLFIRILSAKPSNMIGFLVVLLPYLPTLIRFLLALFIGIGYYLFFIFLIPYLDLKETRYAFIISLVFWMLWSNFNYFNEIATFLYYTAQSRAYITINENVSSFNAFANVGLGMLIVYWLFNNLSFINMLRGLYFLLLNQIRFFDSFLLILASSIKPPNIPTYYGIVAILSTLAILYQLQSLMIDNKTFEILTFNNTKILSINMEYMFIAVFVSENITIAPSMEIGLTNNELFYMLANNTIDCETLKRMGIEYVIDGGRLDLYECLRIERKHKNIVVWKVQ